MSDLYAWPEFTDAMGMGGAGTAISPYTIHNVYDLQAILFDRNAHYKLSADIDGEDADEFDGGCGFIPVPLMPCWFPWNVNEDYLVEGDWTSYPAVLPNYLWYNVRDYHLNDYGPIESYYDWSENDGDDTYIQLQNQYNKRIAFNLKYNPPNPHSRKLPQNLGGDLCARVVWIARNLGTSVMRARSCIKVGGTWYNSSYWNMGAVQTSYSFYHNNWWQNPATSAPWTRDELMGTAASNNLEAWGVLVEGGGTTIFRLTTVRCMIGCSTEVGADYESDCQFLGDFNGNGKTISDLMLNKYLPWLGGIFYDFGGEAYNFKTNHVYHYNDGEYSGDCGVFAHRHMGYAHDIEIRNSELYLIEGGGFAYEIFDDGYTADGEMCNNVKLVNNTIHAGGSYVAGFACTLYSYTDNVAHVVNCYSKNCTIDHEDGATPVDMAGFVSWLWSKAKIEECWCSGSLTSEIGAYGFCVSVGTTGETPDSWVLNCYSRMNLTEHTGDLGQAVTLGGFSQRIDASGAVEKCYSVPPTISSPNSLRAAFVLNANVIGSLTDAHVDAQATPHDLGEGAEENTTAEMKDEDTFTDWDFVNIWSRDDAKNDGYPYLQDAPSSGPPEVYTCSPAVVCQGETNKEVVLTGFNFTLVSSLDFHAGISVIDFDIDSDTQIKAHINVAEDAPLGLQDIDATSIFGTGILVDGIEVQEPAPPVEPPEVHSCNPTWGSPGASGFEVVVDGLHFTGATSVDFHVGVTVNSFSVDGDTQITANIDIAEEASVGYRDVDVTTPNGTGVLVDGFQVTESGPLPPAGSTGTIAIFRAVPIAVSCVS